MQKETTEVCVRGAEDMLTFAASFVEKVKPQTNQATLIALKGDLGAGKTTFVQGVARALGVIEHVTSPTFVIQKVYPTTKSSYFDRLVHIDAYRLESKRELEVLHIEDELKKPKTLMCIEWPEKVPGLVITHTLEFEWVSEHERKVRWQ